MITVESKIGDWLRNGWDDTHVIVGATRSGNLWIVENVYTREISMRIRITSDVAATIEGGN